MKQIYLTEEDIPLHIRFLKLVYSEGKIASVCFQTETHLVNKAKMLIKLIVVNSNHFVRHKCEITHCLDII